MDTIVYETVKVMAVHETGALKGAKLNHDQAETYMKLKIQLKSKMRKANMCERMWRHLPYTCSVKKMTEPIEVKVISCQKYKHYGEPPAKLCQHYKDHFPKAHQMNRNPIEMEDFKGVVSGKTNVDKRKGRETMVPWNKFRRPAPTIPHVATIEAAMKAFISMK